MDSNTPLPLALTTGEPAGIGAEVSLRAALQWQKQPKPLTPLVLVGDYDFLTATARGMALNVQLCHYQAELPHTAPTQEAARMIHVVHVPLRTPTVAGELNAANASYVLELLDTALNGIASQRFSGMVTAPVHKGIINDAGIAFTGHTEYLADKTQTRHVVMMLAGGGMRVALATTHVPLKLISDAITLPSLTRTLDILLHDLTQKFNITQPRVLVTGLNPHAGEGGHMGMEEIDVITPVIQSFQQRGHDVRGPYPADTLFQPHYLNDADAVLAMYHDQGLPVLKYASFGHGVNITLGLPIVRTSVDHGTAIDLAGKNTADAGSMFAAIQCAHDMVQACHTNAPMNVSTRKI